MNRRRGYHQRPYCYEGEPTTRAEARAAERHGRTDYDAEAPERPFVPTAGLVDAVARLQRSAAAVEAS